VHSLQQLAATATVAAAAGVRAAVAAASCIVLHAFGTRPAFNHSEAFSLMVAALAKFPYWHLLYALCSNFSNSGQVY
jgi:hypothetical protein